MGEADWIGNFTSRYIRSRATSLAAKTLHDLEGPQQPKLADAGESVWMLRPQHVLSSFSCSSKQSLSIDIQTLIVQHSTEEF